MEGEGEVSQGCGHPTEDATEANFHLVKEQTREDNGSKQRVVYKCRLKDEVYLLVYYYGYTDNIDSIASLPDQQP